MNLNLILEDVVNYGILLRNLTPSRSPTELFIHLELTY